MHEVTLEPVPPNQAVARYGATAIAFHWTMFALVLILGILGLLHDNWPKTTQGFWINMHAVLGLSLWLELIARFCWRTSHAPPPLPQPSGAFTRRFSGPVHLALYLLLFTTPILGFITFIYHGRIFDFGLFQIDFGLKKDRSIFHPTEDIHGYLAIRNFRTGRIACVGSAVASVLSARPNLS